MPSKNKPDGWFPLKAYPAIGLRLLKRIDKKPQQKGHVHPSRRRHYLTRCLVCDEDRVLSHASILRRLREKRGNCIHCARNPEYPTLTGTEGTLVLGRERPDYDITPPTWPRPTL